jgi:WD40 repeat protein
MATHTPLDQLPSRLTGSGSFLDLATRPLESGMFRVGPLHGHTDVVRSIALSPDGKRVVSGSYDKTIRIWDAESGEVVAGPFHGHRNMIRSVAFSPDGKRVFRQDNSDLGCQN